MRASVGVSPLLKKRKRTLSPHFLPKSTNSLPVEMMTAMIRP